MPSVTFSFLEYEFIISLNQISISVSYTHLDVYKRQVLHHGYRNVDETKDILFNDSKSILIHDYLRKYPISKNNYVR